MTKHDIPLARPDITRAEIDAVIAVLETPHLSLGPKVAEFEQAFAEYCGTRHAVACSSGTAGLHLLMLAYGVGPGDEVVTSPFSFVASANCALMAGAEVVFTDIDPATWNICPDAIDAAITPKTKAIIPVDVFGTVPDFDRISAIAKAKGVAVIEDSCEALGTRMGDRRAGSLGDAGGFGFYPNKQITTGEGGMIVTDDESVAKMCRSLRNQGRDVEGGWLAHPRMGFNYRLSDINCAIGLAQLGRIEEIIAARGRVARLYRERLVGDHRFTMQKALEGVEVSWFVFVIRLSDEFTRQDRDRVLVELRDRGIGCSNYFAPIHLQPFYVERGGFKRGDFPVCEALADRSIALPFHHQMTERDVDTVCTELSSALGSPE